VIGLSDNELRIVMAAAAALAPALRSRFLELMVVHLRGVHYPRDAELGLERGPASDGASLFAGLRSGTSSSTRASASKKPLPTMGMASVACFILRSSNLCGDVRYGSTTDILRASTDVRFTPKADIGTQRRDVRFSTN
jgi:hypothetical protein